MKISLLIWFSILSFCHCFYDEKLVVRPLPNQHVLTSFQFKLQSDNFHSSISNNTATHYNTFPRAFPPLLESTNTKELHMRFSQGWYDSESWGLLPYNGFKSGGTGVELWAILSSDSKDNVEKNWYKLTNSLSALFCASLNFIDSSTTTYPKKSFHSHNSILIPEDEKLYLLRSALPREPVCTENLTPFLKLIPTKGKLGIGSLLDGHKVFDAQWNSMSIDLYTVYNEDGSYYYDMDLNIDLVMNVPKKLEINQNPIIKPIPGEQLNCDPSKKHDLYYCFPLVNKSNLTINLQELFGKDIAGKVPFGDNWSQLCSIADPEVWKISGIVVGPEKEPGEPAHSIYSKDKSETCFYLDQTDVSYNLELKTENCSHVVPLMLPHLKVSRSLSGYSQGSAALRMVFRNSGEEDVDIVYFETLPWFLRIYLSSLKISGSEPHDIFYSPSKDRLRPSHLEMLLTIPANTTVTMSYDFDKSLLLLAEYPPDANHGFDIEPAVVSIFQNGKKTYQLRTNSLLVTLPTPDFSMPYNVIILTGTVTSLVFGAIFQMLFKKVLTVEEYDSILSAPRGIDKLKLKIQNLKSKLLGKKYKSE